MGPNRDDFVRLKEYQNKPHVLVSLLGNLFNTKQYRTMEQKLREGYDGARELNFSDISALIIIYACNDEGGPDCCKPAVTYITSHDHH